MPNSITLPKGYQAALDEVYRLASLTSVLNSEPGDLRPTQNVNEFCYPQLSVGGLGDYKRNSGYTANSGVNLVWKTATADYDRGTRIMVDDVDNQESFDIAFGKAGATLMREHVAPEGDAYTFAKLASLSGVGEAEEDFAGAQEFLLRLLAASSQMDEDEVPGENRYLFATPTLINGVKALDTDKSREALEGFAGIVKVPQARFYTAIDLLDGSSVGEELGGWKKAAGGADINFMIVHKPAVIKYDKHVANHLISPESNPDADAYICKYRRYGIVDGYENKRAGIYVSHKPAA